MLPWENIPGAHFVLSLSESNYTYHCEDIPHDLIYEYDTSR